MENNLFYLSGQWKNNKDNMEAVADAKVYLKYFAKEIYAVAGEKGTIKVFVDGKNVQNVSTEDHTLYTLAQQSYAPHDLVLEVSPGVKIYTFTFG
jgi:hypothetical protein